jgi:hypothetical protein
MTLSSKWLGVNVSSARKGYRFGYKRKDNRELSRRMASSSRSSKAHQGHKPVFAVFAYYDFQQIGPDFLNDFRLEEQAECGGAMNLSKAMDYD